jgi:hypothetical protein
MAAIYQWFEGLVEVQIWTTTLYPLEAAEGILFSTDLDIGQFQLLPNDTAQYTSTFLDADKELILLSTGPHDDTAQYASTFLDADKELILLSTGPHDDFGQYASAFLDADKESKLVTIYSPDQGLIMDIDLDTANCSMDAV